jgi:hypothetical protein
VRVDFSLFLLRKPIREGYKDEIHGGRFFKENWDAKKMIRNFKMIFFSLKI